MWILVGTVAAALAAWGAARALHRCLADVPRSNEDWVFF